LRVVLDSNVFISALISAGGAPHAIYRAWRERRFVLVTGDAKHLLRLRHLGRTRILAPAAFLRAIG
jgi:predicted nucleic acid-binding protein